jgi:hypothetical protein
VVVEEGRKFGKGGLSTLPFTPDFQYTDDSLFVCPLDDVQPNVYSYFGSLFADVFRKGVLFL